jgi:short subunit dehydrogenase-like uncharacterized protein
MDKQTMGHHSKVLISALTLGFDAVQSSCLKNRVKSGSARNDLAKTGCVIRSFAQSDFVKMAVVLAREYLQAGGKVG